MKILIVHNQYLSRNIGGEDVVFENEVQSLMSLLGSGNVLTYKVSNDNLSKFKLLFTIWFSVGHYFKIKKIIKENKIDLVHVHNFFPLLTPSVFKAAKNGGAKVIHTLHNFRWWCISGILYREEAGICELCIGKKYPVSGIKYNCYRKSKLQSIYAQLAFWFYRTLGFYDDVDAFFVLSAFQKQKVINFGLPVAKILLKPNGCAQPFQKKVEKSGYIYVGRLEKSKGVDVLLNVWKELDLKFELTIIGEGELEQMIEDLNLTNVIYLGKKPHTEVKELINKSKYLIQPSVWFETFGLTIIEGLSCGTPVIGFNIGTRPSFIRNEFNGLLCMPDTLKETILYSESLTNYELISDNARLSAKEYSLENVTMQQVKLYSKVMGDFV